MLSDLYPGAVRTNEGSGLLDDGDVAVDFDGTLPVHGRVSRDDRVAFVDLAHVAELVDGKLNGASAVGVDALAEERDRARVVDDVSDGGKEPLVCPSKDVVVRTLRSLGGSFPCALPATGVFNRVM